MQAQNNRDVTLLSITPVVTVTTVPGSREKLQELGEVLATFKKMPARQRRRYEGLTLRQTRRDPAFRWHHSAARRSCMATDRVGRQRTAPRAREHRPAATRRTSSSSSTASDPPAAALSSAGAFCPAGGTEAAA